MRAPLSPASHSKANLSGLKNNSLERPSATLCLLDGSHVAERDLKFFAQQLSTSESHRYQFFRRRERQRQFLLGRMLLRLAVAKLISRPLDALAIIEREDNLPQLVVRNEPHLQPAFSISHSRNWVACVVSSNVSLGLDIEVESPARDIIGISQSSFHPKDHGWLLSQPETARLSAFYQLWCTKEALYKLLSSLGRENILSPLVGSDGTVAAEGCCWHRFSLPHSGLALVICSNQPLSVIHRLQLNGLTTVDLMTANESWSDVQWPAVRPKDCLVS
jgi:4'-phosphopantetheinyl transferase